MALTETYVDPSIAGDSGAGTSGDPYGDLQYALNTMTRDGTNGDRINIKAGSDEVLSAALSLATYGTPTNGARLLFQGYTSTAGDGGIGGISGNGSYSLFSSAPNYVGLIDMHIHNSGSATVMNLNSYCYTQNCEIDNTTGNGIVTGSNSQIVNCYIHNCGAIGCDTAIGCMIIGCHFENGTNDFTLWIYRRARLSVWVHRVRSKSTGARRDCPARRGYPTVGSSTSRLRTASWALPRCG